MTDVVISKHKIVLFGPSLAALSTRSSEAGSMRIYRGPDTGTRKDIGRRVS